MWLSDTSIKRPVLAIVMSSLLLLFGVFCLTRLAVREYPDIDPPIISVSTVYPGASPEVIETTITEPLEDELTSIEGIKTISSKSQEQISSISIEFDLSRDVDLAAQDVRDRVSRARGQLPDDIEEPIVAKQDADAQAILWISLYGDNYSPLQLTDYADRYIVDQLQAVSGVGRVIIGGKREYAMRLWLDPAKLTAHGVTALDVEEALRNENVEIPSGRVEGRFREFTIRTQGEMRTPEEFNQLIIKKINGIPVYLRDVGYAKVGARDDRSLVRFNGKPAVGLGIVKQSKANTLDVAHGVKAKMEEIKANLSPGLNMQSAFDTSLFIEQSIHEVEETLLIAGLLVVLVIFLFLRDWRSTLIPAIAIPVSIVATFGIMYLMGFSINILTLLALTLSIGLVVDDTIVVLENIYRRIELGETPWEASIKGTREIGFAVLATTFSLVSIFIPLAFMTGTTGRLFNEFAIAVAGSVLISGFVSLSLAPMLSSRLLKAHAETVSSRNGLLNRLLDPVSAFLDRMTEDYHRSLSWAMDHIKGVLVGVGTLVVVSLTCLFFLPQELLPLEDRGQIMTIVEAPEGSTLAYTDKAVRQAEQIYQNLPEVSKFFSVMALSAEGVGRVNSGFLFVTLHPQEERKRKQQDIVGSIIPQMMSIPEAFAFPINPPSGPQRGFGKPIQFVVQGFNLQELAEYSDKVLQRARQIPGFINVDSDLKLDKPQLEIRINREKAAELGVSVRDIATTLQILMGGKDLSTFQLNNKRYDVMVQVPASLRGTPEKLETLYVNGRDDALIPLTSVVDYRESVAPKELNHYARLRSATISGSLAPTPGLAMGTIMKQLQQIAKEELPPGMRTAWAGESKELTESQSATFIVFLMALVVVFLVLSAQFESFLHPFIILLTVPLAVCGAVFSLFLSGSTLNIYSQIGVILLIGLVTKNGILIVEYANQQLEHHPQMTTLQAAMEAAKVRFRPILMTSVATIFGAVPIAIGLGAGAESRKPLGIAIVGGMILATFLTLYVIPMVYHLLNRNVKRTSIREQDALSGDPV